jgi:pilus assembly protein CpaF
MNAIPQEIFESALDYFLQPISGLLADENVREIMINGIGQIFIENKGLLEKTDITFDDEDALMSAVKNIAQYAGHYIRPTTGRFDARLPAGHRVHVVLPPICRQGISVTIRKHTKSSFRLDDLVRLGSISEETKEFLRFCMEKEKNMIISGGTGTGKTTFINAVSALIPPTERIITIEDAAELQLNQEHVVSLEARAPDRKGEGGVAIRDLLHSSLRMRPDRIIVGECRGGEALDLLQAMNTGHGGSMSTLHANSPIESLRRLETLALFSGEEIPLRFLRAQVASAIDVVVQLQRLRAKRTVHSIAEVLPLTESGEYAVHEIYSYNYAKEELERVGVGSFERDGAGAH